MLRAGPARCTSSAAEWSVLALPRTLQTYQDFAAVPGAAWIVGEKTSYLRRLWQRRDLEKEKRFQYWLYRDDAVHISSA